MNASGDDFLYLLGVKVDVHESGEMAFSDGSKIVYKNKEELNKKLRKFFKDLMIKTINKVNTTKINICKIIWYKSAIYLVSFSNSLMVFLK